MEKQPFRAAPGEAWPCLALNLRRRVGGNLQRERIARRSRRVDTPAGDAHVPRPNPHDHELGAIPPDGWIPAGRAEVLDGRRERQGWIERDERAVDIAVDAVER